MREREVKEGRWRGKENGTAKERHADKKVVKQTQ